MVQLQASVEEKLSSSGSKREEYTTNDKCKTTTSGLVVNHLDIGAKEMSTKWEMQEKQGPRRKSH